jgi:hypothetical protein
MLLFFERSRVSDCPIEHGAADMLLYQWGTYDWGSGERFELDITRQVIPLPDTPDPDILQLHLVFRFLPTPELRLAGSGNRWCESLGAVESFRNFVLGSAAYQAVASRSDGSVELLFEFAE